MEEQSHEKSDERPYYSPNYIRSLGLLDSSNFLTAGRLGTQFVPSGRLYAVDDTREIDEILAELRQNK